MYESYLANENGLYSIDINTANAPKQPAHNITFTYAIGTRKNALATLSIDHTGEITTAFGGTGTTREELDAYITQAISIWRTITGNHTTDCTHRNTTYPA